jgi:hypothetical protein
MFFAKIDLRDAQWFSRTKTLRQGSASRQGSFMQ